MTFWGVDGDVHWVFPSVSTKIPSTIVEGDQPSPGKCHNSWRVYLALNLMNSTKELVEKEVSEFVQKLIIAKPVDMVSAYKNQETVGNTKAIQVTVCPVDT